MQFKSFPAAISHPLTSSFRLFRRFETGALMVVLIASAPGANPGDPPSPTPLPQVIRIEDDFEGPAHDMPGGVGDHIAVVNDPQGNPLSHEWTNDEAWFTDPNQIDGDGILKMPMVKVWNQYIDSRRVPLDLEHGTRWALLVVAAMSESGTELFGFLTQESHRGPRTRTITLRDGYIWLTDSSVFRDSNDVPTGAAYAVGQPYSYALIVDEVGNISVWFQLGAHKSLLEGSWIDITPEDGGDLLTLEAGPNVIGINCRFGSGGPDFEVDYIALLQNPAMPVEPVPTLAPTPEPSPTPSPTPTPPPVEVAWTGALPHAPFIYRQGHTCLVFDDKMWVIGGSTIINDEGTILNDVWWSGDGSNWHQAISNAAFPPTMWHTSVVFDGKMWIIGGFARVDGSPRYVNDVWSSSDGITWNHVTSEAPFTPRVSHTSTVFDNKIWVIAGRSDSYKNDVWWSSDGISWNQTTSDAGFTPRDSHTSVSFDNKMWVIGGEIVGTKFSDAWWSIDGVTWNRATFDAAFSIRSSHASVVFDDKMWVIGGNSSGRDRSSQIRNDVWSSSDGITWQQWVSLNAFAPRRLLQAIVFDEKVWVIGGTSGKVWAVGHVNPDVYFNDVWYSSLQPVPTPTPTPEATPPPITISWHLTTEHAAFSPRRGHASVVFDDKMWVIAGREQSGGLGPYLKDAWWSTDGFTWHENPEPPFRSRYHHACLAYDGKIWIIGGISYGTDLPGNNRLNDVWWTDNGVDWTRATSNAPFTSAQLRVGFVYDNKMWIGTNREVWWSTDGANWEHVTSYSAFDAQSPRSGLVFDDKMWVAGASGDDVWWSSDGFNWKLIGNPVFTPSTPKRKNSNH